MSQNKALSMIGLATKAGKVASGEFCTEKEVKSGRAYLVIVADNASDNTKKKFQNMCDFYQVPIYFYKDKDTGIGCFGAAGKNALPRILSKIQLKEPVFSNFDSELEIYQKDAVELSKELKNLDIVYLDPPYNQHPYGSNYFMLNLIIKNKIDVEISKVSGITQDWNRSVFNKPSSALKSMEEIIASLSSKFVIISYNSEGFITFDEMSEMLKKYGKLKTVEITYNTFRGSRNLQNRDIHVSEYLFILEK